MEFDAAVLQEVQGELVVDRVQLAPLQRTDVLVRNHASGLCHTDLEIMTGSLAYPRPVVLGHEGAGVVEAIGDGVTMVKPGDHVVASWNPSCGRCFYCDRNQPILCELCARANAKGVLLDGTSRLSRRGQAIHHFNFVSSHAEYSVLPENGAIRIPDEVPFDRACLLGCGVMTGVGAVTNIARVPVGASVLVVGCGAVGLNVIQGCRLVRAERILALDVSPSRLELARFFGATDLLLANDAPLEQVRALTAGRGVDFGFEAAGTEAAMRVTVEATRPGGQVVILGKINFEQTAGFRFGSLMGEKRITRSSYGGARPRRDFPLLANAYLEGAIKLDELITHRLPLASINDGFRAMGKGEVLRAVLMLPG